jgi:hypothetical protein
VHNVHYLKDIKYAFSDCELIADKGYTIDHYRQDLFTQSQIKLCVPALQGQLAFVEFSRARRQKRKRFYQTVRRISRGNPLENH